MKPRNSESGFTIAALLCIITAALVLTAAAVPVYQMQARRELEKELIFRGEEYMRAIQKYQRKYPGNYPPSIDDLLSRDGLRFLRRQYKDPITGEDFRLINVNPDGSLTNALTILTIPIPAQGTGLAPGLNPSGAPSGGGNVPGPTSSGNNPPSAFGTSMGLGVSMGTLTGGAGGGPGGGRGGAGGGIGGGAGGGIGTGVANAGSGRGAGTGGGGGVGVAGTGAGIGMIGNTGIVSGQGGITGIPPGQQNSGGRGQGNPGPAGGLAGGPANSTQMPQQIGPGIAGVASDSVADAVMVYNTREKYNEWEFVAPLIMQQGPSGNAPGPAGNTAPNQGINPLGNRGSGIVPPGGGQNPTTIFTNPANNPFTGGAQGGATSGAPGTAPAGRER